MPKRKKLPTLPDYTDIPRDDDRLIVQKSNPLQSLSETELTLPEFKILDAYLARIDSHNPNKRTVKLEKGELERTLKVSRILKDDLDKRLRHLFQVIEVKDNSKRKGFKLINLFEEADAEQDDDGLWQITLTCTPSAREYVFNIDNIGYLRYRLKNIVNFTSRYSYILYLYLENNRFRKSWKINLNELKKILNCNAERYNQFKYFNSEILKKSQQELHKKTDLRFSFEPTDKKGRSYTAIQFTLETVSDKLSSPKSVQQSLPEQQAEQLTFGYDKFKEKEINYGGELADLLGNVSCNDEFSPEQIRILQDLVIQAVGYADHLKYCNYLIHQVHKMNLYDSKKKIKDRFAYLCKMIEKDI